MAEIEYQGIKFKGGKIFIVLSLIGAIIGGGWTMYGFYDQFLDMQSKIQNYTAPDLSSIEERLALLEESNKITNEYVSEIRNDLKDDIRRTEDIAYSAERFAKETERSINDDIKALKDELDLKINKALNNPLSSM
jgi:hypothetical protein